ncbi:DUF6615 family protein [Deinococcus cellulosilyticus]|uniref:Uncharacterized protein n=1 Tax=Deinococcus cellulosilyticus (strain DSM 18568 / NBRC 106333 / KACC 11606 / 5516J-15) TaxID=1223518 RepID=A0A511NAE3_DEIC1|nr:DUF6615 family protein [Deinococcus cellulosilyticus]GEM49780.1 hypothetical protein DC3_54150 [Deinococcus cellulosilyticus NBRC 106333 = KACC 11606]
MIHKTFERLARYAWQTLEEAHELDFALGEETLTETLLLQLKRMKNPAIQVVPYNKTEESLNGADWEWWIQDGSSYHRVAVQAKKISRNGRYKSFIHEVGAAKTPQIHLLRTYALANGALPLYCLYNHHPKAKADHLNCLRGKQKDLTQLGCTLMPIDAADLVYSKTLKPEFIAIHEHSINPVPWRCLFLCGLVKKPACKFRPEHRWGILWMRLRLWLPLVKPIPREQVDVLLQRLRDAGPDAIDEPGGLLSEFFASEVGLYPKYVVIIQQDADQRSSQIEDWTF